MNILLDRIKHEISQAKQSESQQASIEIYIRDNLEALQNAIAINSDIPVSTIMKFVIGYVDSAPEHLEAAHALSSEIQLQAYTQPFLNLACAYFVQPPKLLASFGGLQGLLYKAYLVNRLMEEVNDQVESISSVALVPIDLSVTNIICHTLIGEELANQLDHLILLSLETVEADKGIFNRDNVKMLMQQRKNKGWDEVLKRWSCFTQNLSDDLQICRY